ncbi:MAG: hypothetical protein DWP92_06870 [Armatimonadetes bacterium]|nr:MAG: hypothetical protein DWP92_06870 [Armatimonadota bacterium]
MDYRLAWQIATHRRGTRDMSDRPRRLLVVGMTLAILAGVHWIWLASTDRDTASAFGSLTGAALVILGALLWAAVERNKS